MLRYGTIVILLALYQVKRISCQDESEETSIEKEFPCPTKCSPIHYCLITVFTNFTARVSCKECVDVCRSEENSQSDTNNTLTCEKYCPAVWNILHNSSDSTDNKDQQLQTLLYKHADFKFHNVLLPVPATNNVSRTISGCIMAVVAVLVCLLVGKGMSVLEARYGIVRSDDKEAIIPPDTLALPDAAEAGPGERGATHESIQLQEVSGSTPADYGTVEKQADSSPPPQNSQP